jgi:two-component system copper resistance phosphate regulon response regulator CusR
MHSEASPRKTMPSARLRAIFAYDATVRVLLVEDDPGVQRFVVKGLREQAYAVDSVSNGEDALYQAEINSYDLIILDVMIPGVDGFEVCRRVRELERKTPILMLTARDAIDDRIAGLDQGADDYLTKPFEFRELLARMRALLRRPKELRPQKFSIKDLTLDPAGQTARRGDRAISLTHKEYALLEYLARNAGRVVGRAEISEHVWDENFDPFSNLIEVYVNRLRRKVDAPGEEPLLHTRRGAGYVLGQLPSIDSEKAQSRSEKSFDTRKPSHRKADA